MHRISLSARARQAVLSQNVFPVLHLPRKHGVLASFVVVQLISQRLEVDSIRCALPRQSSDDRTSADTHHDLGIACGYRVCRSTLRGSKWRLILAARKRGEYCEFWQRRKRSGQEDRRNPSINPLSTHARRPWLPVQGIARQTSGPRERATRRRPMRRLLDHALRRRKLGQMVSKRMASFCQRLVRPACDRTGENASGPAVALYDRGDGAACEHAWPLWQSG